MDLRRRGKGAKGWGLAREPSLGRGRWWPWAGVGGGGIGVGRGWGLRGLGRVFAW